MNERAAASGAASAHGLAPNGLLASALWLDQPEASREIERRLATGRISAEEAANLEKFRRDGFFVFRPEIDDGLFAALDGDVERLWSEQPPWMAWAYHSLLTRFSGGDEGNRQPSCRIADLHEYSDAALELYLHPQIFRYVDLIFEEPGVATQSLYFEWGSQQALHRDPIHVRMNPPSALVAAWIALEDIRPGSGELFYVPGSHRLPYFEFAPGRFFFDHREDAPERAREAERWDLERCAEKGLAPEPLHCRRGECLFWHHSLLHGGGELTDRELTRKSFVVHYTTLSGMPETTNTYRDPWAGQKPEAELAQRVYRSARRHRLRGCHGFVSPLAERFAEESRSLFRGGGESDRRLLEAQAEVSGLRGEIEAMKASRFWKLHDAWWRLRRALAPGH